MSPDAFPDTSSTYPSRLSYRHKTIKTTLLPLTLNPHVENREVCSRAHNGSLDSDDHWPQWVSTGRIGRRTRKSRRKNGQRSPLSRNLDFVITNSRYGVSDMRECVKIAFGAFRKPLVSSPIYLLTNRGSLVVRSSNGDV